MSWIDKIWPKRAKAKSKQGSNGALVPAFGQDLEEPDELISRANKRAVRGDLDGAIADIDSALELSPTKATSFYNRGYLHNLSGNYQQAIQDCSEAIALLPDYDEAFYQRGIAKIKLGNIEAAIVDLSEVLRLNPFSIKTYYKRANCYAAQNDIQGAVADYTQAILRMPKDFNAYIQRGLFLSKLQEYRTAIEDFSSALSFNPKSADAYYHRGCCYAELGEKEKATRDFNQAMLYDPNQRAADYNRTYALGIIKESKNLPPAASPSETPIPIQDNEAVVLSLNTDQPTVITSAEMAETSQTQPPSPLMGGLVRQTDVDVLFVEGSKKAEMGDFEGAIDAYTKILEYEPENARAYLERGKSFARIGETDLADDDMKAAVRCAKQKSLNLMKDYSGTLTETLNTLKLDLQHSKEHSPTPSSQGNQSIEAEIIKCSQAIHRNPLDASAYFKRAQSRALIGDLDGAIADYTRTISLEPEHRDAYYKRGMLLDAMGDRDRATADLDRAIRRTHLLLPFKAARSSQDIQTYEEVISDRIETPHQHNLTDPSSSTEQQDSMPSAEMDVTHAVASSEIQTAAPSNTHTSNINADAFSEGQRRSTRLQSEDQEISAEDTLPTATEDLKAEELETEELETETSETEPHVEQDIEPHVEQDIPTYFSDLVLDPCTHEGNDPNNRYCVHCGQPLSPISESHP